MNGEFASALSIELAAGLVIAIIGFFTGYIFNAARKKYQERRGPLAGKWIQRARDPNNNNLIIKEDTVVCTQIGEIVEATITRKIPESDAGRTWNFHGVFRDGYLIGHFSNQNLTDPSFGTIYLRNRKRNYFKGNYMKSNDEGTEDWKIDMTKYHMTPLEWVFDNGTFVESEEEE